MIVHNYGRSAVLVELDSPLAALTLRRRLEQAPPPGTVETMPGLQTVLVRFDPRLTDEARLATALGEVDLGRDPDDTAAPDGEPEEIEVAVRYDGADLAEVAAATGLRVAEVIEAHRAARYRVVLIGMAPGFYFLAGGDPRLTVRRRSSPRTEVPKGAVGLAGAFTGIYPRRGPGGWQLIGRAVDDLWHPSRLPAARLSVGTAVRFTAG